MSLNNNKQPATWTELNHFSVSEKGAIKPSGSGYAGSPCYLTLDAAKHILNNIDSFRKAIEMSEERTLKKEISKELAKMQVTFIKMGLSPEEAAVAVQAVLDKKKKVS